MPNDSAMQRMPEKKVSPSHPGRVSARPSRKIPTRNSRKHRMNAITSPMSALLSFRRRLAAVRLLDLVDQFVLVHAGAARDVQSLGHIEQVRLRRVRVHTLLGLRGGVASAGSLAVRRSVLVFALPVVADLLVLVLECGECGAVCALALAVLLDRRVVRLGPERLSVLLRALERGGELL